MNRVALSVGVLSTIVFTAYRYFYAGTPKFISRFINSEQLKIESHAADVLFKHPINMGKKYRQDVQTLVSNFLSNVDHPLQRSIHLAFLFG